MDMMEISNKFGSVTLSLMGAQIRSYRPAGMKEDILFAPKTMAIDGTKHVHGGIPVCWPWFGRNGEPGSVSHGFARTSLYEVRTTRRRSSSGCIPRTRRGGSGRTTSTSNTRSDSARRSTSSCARRTRTRVP